MIPPANRGRTWQANTFYCPLLVDGFLAGVWRILGDALVIEPFTELSRQQRAEVTREGERMVRVLHAEESYDVRFGTVIP